MPYDGTLPRVSLPQLLYLLPPILPDRRLPKIYLERGVGLTQRQGFLNCSASVRQACAFSVMMDWRDCIQTIPL